MKRVSIDYSFISLSGRYGKILLYESISESLSESLSVETGIKPVISSHDADGKKYSYSFEKGSGTGIFFQGSYYHLLHI